MMQLVRTLVHESARTLVMSLVGASSAILWGRAWRQALSGSESGRTSHEYSGLFESSADEWSGWWLVGIVGIVRL